MNISLAKDQKSHGISNIHLSPGSSRMDEANFQSAIKIHEENWNYDVVEGDVFCVICKKNYKFSEKEEHIDFHKTPSSRELHPN